MRAFVVRKHALKPDPVWGEVAWPEDGPPRGIDTVMTAEDLLASFAAKRQRLAQQASSALTRDGSLIPPKPQVFNKICGWRWSHLGDMLADLKEYGVSRAEP